jgi:hypothetical protein
MPVFGWLRSLLVVLNPATHARNIFANMSFRAGGKNLGLGSYGDF